MRMYRSLLRFVQIAIVLVVLPRVASFVSNLGVGEVGFDLHDVISVAFAAVLGLGVVASSYFSDSSEPPYYDDEPTNARERRRREREAVYYATMHQAAPYARRSLIGFAILDGTFNLADALTGAVAAGRFQVAAVIGTLDYNIEFVSVSVYLASVILFGLAPTFLAVYLAKLNSMVDRIPLDYERPATRKEIDWVRTLMGNFGVREYNATQAMRALAGGEEEEQPVRRSSPVRDQILSVLNYHARQGTVLSYSQLVEALGEDGPAPSTISTVRKEWLESAQNG